MKTSISPALLKLKSQFEAWRKTRASIRTRTPEHLRQAALTLLDHHPASLISRVCQINPRMLQARRAPEKQVRPIPDFFPLPPPSSSPPPAPVPPHAPAHTTYRVVIERPDGARLTISLPALDPASLSTFCADFLRS
jgi:hypothetical protein